ncbi:MAG: hypothetical protein H7Y18_09005, partial [Clostridiaceae bacterium]|nr:hypothetical protein [Clostridiaceae bacterium]
MVVKDDVHYQTGNGGDIWQGDGMQIAIDPERGTGVTGAGHYEYGFALSDTGVQKWRWSAAYGRSTGKVDNESCSIKRDEDNKTTTYEVAIPFTDILADGKQLSLNNLLGFSLVVNNSTDGDRGYLQYCGGIAGDKNTENEGSLILEKSVPTNNAPVITITGIEDGKAYIGSAAAIVTADKGILTLTLDGKTYNSGDKITSVGKHTLITKSIDADGNKTEKTITFTINAVNAPVITITGIEDGKAYIGSAAAIVTADKGILTLTLDGKTYNSGDKIT